MRPYQVWLVIALGVPVVAGAVVCLAWGMARLLAVHPILPWLAIWVVASFVLAALVCDDGDSM